MKQPILVLQYPDPRQGRTVAIASTKDPAMLHAFKETVLQEARLATMDWVDDEALLVLEQAELKRLQAILELLIPDDEED